MKVTMQDVANEAGVDKATVSRALSGDHRISEKTREKVMEAVRKLNYSIDKNARNLSTSRSRLISVVLPNLAVSWLGVFMAGLDRALANSDYEMLLKSTDGNPLRAARELGKLRDSKVEGIIWGDSGNRMRLADVPLITLGYSDEDSYSIKTDGGEEPVFETGALAGRLMLRLISGRTVPSREIIVRTASEAIL